MQDRGRIALSYGRHRIIIDLSFSPVDCEIRLEPYGIQCCCATPTEINEVKLLPAGIEVKVEVGSNLADLVWRAWDD